MLDKLVPRVIIFDYLSPRRAFISYERRLDHERNT